MVSIVCYNRTPLGPNTRRACAGPKNYRPNIVVYTAVCGILVYDGAI